MYKCRQDSLLKIRNISKEGKSFMLFLVSIFNLQALLIK